MSDDLAPVPVEGPLSEEEIDLFGEYRCLLPILVEGERMLVPENNSLLRALQFVELKSARLKLDWGRYCWNDTKGCCEVLVRSGTQEMTTRACKLGVSAGLEVLRLPKGGRRCG